MESPLRSSGNAYPSRQRTGLESRDLRGLRIDSRDVCTFVSIAMNAGKRQIVKIIDAAMLSGDDVIDLEWGRVQRAW